VIICIVGYITIEQSKVLQISQDYVAINLRERSNFWEEAVKSQGLLPRGNKATNRGRINTDSNGSVIVQIEKRDNA
jgi:hypothetical protein